MTYRCILSKIEYNDTLCFVKFCDNKIMILGTKAWWLEDYIESDELVITGDRKMISNYKERLKALFNKDAD